MNRGRWWRLGLQVALVGIVGLLVWRQLGARWDEFSRLNMTLTPHAGSLSVAVLLVALTYAVQIESWRRVLAGWNQHLPYHVAARIWWIANLGRYVPGKVWSIAGLVVLAGRAGVPALIAAASTVALQAISVATCVALIAATVGTRVGTAVSPLALAVAALVAVGAIGVLALPAPARAIARRIPSASALKPLPLRAALGSGILAQISWLSYGVAFWFLARGLVPSEGLRWSLAAGVFALGYLSGLLVIFAPGGIGVRESVHLMLLSPSVGLGAAVAITVASRLLLTAMEGVAGAAAFLIPSGPRREAGDAS
jgi:hypothetical protein